MYSAWIVLFSLLNVWLCSAEEGDKCTINALGEKGTCKPIPDCPYAQDLLKNKKFPQTCGFVGINPLVCCVSRFEEPTQLPEKINNVQKRPSLLLQNLAVVSGQNPGELSRNKCLYYYPKPLYPSFVTGGTPSLAKEFPHMAIIGYGGKENVHWLCGGSLISRKFVLTAAHCLTSIEGDAKFVRLGDLDLSTEEDLAEPQDFTIVRRIPHPSYRPPARYHDIALLELDREVALSAYVSPACLNTKREFNQTRLTATGWGNTVFTGNASSFLLKVELDYVTNDQCVEDFGRTSNILLPNSIVDDIQICAGGVIGQDTCQGDSGGPLQVKNYERSFFVKVHNIIGVTSFGKACGLSKAPGIYTRVSNYISWIESIAWKNEKEDSLTFKPISIPLLNGMSITL